MVAEREPLTTGPTPGLDALARVAGVDRATFDENPRAVLAALRTAAGEVVDVALGLGAQDTRERDAAEARRRDLQEKLGPARTGRPWQDVVGDALDRLTRAVRESG